MLQSQMIKYFIIGVHKMIQQQVVYYNNLVVNDSKSLLILSPSDYVYLNSGQGFITGNKFGTYSTWRNIYLNFTPFPVGVNPKRIYGAEACLWGEVSN